MITLIAVGLFVGVISGFFGVGGGMILVPILMAIGFDIKSAIAISTVQMVFSSVNGSIMNYFKGKLQVNEGVWVGGGGLLGGVVGARMTDWLPHETLQYIFLALILFALVAADHPLFDSRSDGGDGGMVAGQQEPGGEEEGKCFHNFMPL